MSIVSGKGAKRTTLNIMTGLDSINVQRSFTADCQLMRRGRATVLMRKRWIAWNQLVSAHPYVLLVHLTRMSCPCAAQGCFERLPISRGHSWLCSFFSSLSFSSDIAAIGTTAYQTLSLDIKANESIFCMNVPDLLIPWLSVWTLIFTSGLFAKEGVDMEEDSLREVEVGGIIAFFLGYLSKAVERHRNTH